MNVELCAEALFVSRLQECDCPDTRRIRTAVDRRLSAMTLTDIEAEVAQEFGDHPGEAAARMRWCLTAVAEVSGLELAR